MKILQFFDASSFMPVERVWKPRDKPAPYARKPGPKGKHAKDETETSAKSAATKQRDNLTLRDWLTVFAFIDAHPTLSQERVVDHFSSLENGSLKFTQSTLSRKIKQRPELEERVNSNPSALSSKRPRIVTRPDVERALVIWLRSMEEKRETVNGKMLVEKRKLFEKRFDVPEIERLEGESWVQSFCKTWGFQLWYPL
jgi:hypothetical protein